MYSDVKNYKGKSIISNNRMFMWGTRESNTTLYMSYIDDTENNSTDVSAEVTAGTSGTLAFKSG